MKYYVGTVLAHEQVPDRKHHRHLLIAARDERSATAELQKLVADWANKLEGADVGGAHGHRLPQENNPLTVTSLGVKQISAAAFFGMEGIPRIGNDVSGDLLTQDASEQTKTLARRLVAQFERLGLKGAKGLSYGKTLEALAASLGETDWQVLKHKAVIADAQLDVPQGEAVSEATVREPRARDAGSLPAPSWRDIPQGGTLNRAKAHITLDIVGRAWYWSAGEFPPHFKGEMGDDGRAIFGFPGKGLNGPFESPDAVITGANRWRATEDLQIDWIYPMDPSIDDFTAGTPFKVLRDGAAGEFRTGIATLAEALNIAKEMRDAGAAGKWRVEDRDSQLLGLFTGQWKSAVFVKDHF